MKTKLLEPTDRGLYCPQGDFFIDPWRPVDRAIITHGHSDHARWGSNHYLATPDSIPILRHRLGQNIVADALPYGETVVQNGVRVSLHPAGHVLGSAQVRLESAGEIVVISGDYKLADDATCTPFEPVKCHTFVTESTFGLPIYRWQSTNAIAEQMNAWWRRNREAGKASLLYGYALGKAQRMLAMLDDSIGPIYTHGAVERLNAVYRQCGIRLPSTTNAAELPRGTKFAGSLIVAPPSAHGSTWARKFAPASSGMASGWMTIRGAKRRRAIDAGFVLSDHVDWPSMVAAIHATEATQIYVTHGYTATVVRWLREQGFDADILPTRFEGEIDEPTEAEQP